MGEKNIVVIGKEFPPMKTLVLLGLAILTGFLMAVVYYTLTNAFDEKTPAQPQQYQIPPQFYNQYSQYYNKPQFYPPQAGYYPPQQFGPPQGFPQYPMGIQAYQSGAQQKSLLAPSASQYPFTLNDAGAGQEVVAPAPIHEGWCPWNSWSECSAKCLGGTRSRSRKCEGGKCKGNDKESSTCNTGCCPVNGGFSEWGLWVTVPGNAESRYRKCDNPAPKCAGKKCAGETTQTRSMTAVKQSGSPKV